MIDYFACSVAFAFSLAAPTAAGRGCMRVAICRQAHEATCRHDWLLSRLASWGWCCYRLQCLTAITGVCAPTALIESWDFGFSTSGVLWTMKISGALGFCSLVPGWPIAARSARTLHESRTCVYICVRKKRDTKRESWTAQVFGYPGPTPKYSKSV